jgi:hypothetical protein
MLPVQVQDEIISAIVPARWYCNGHVTTGFAVQPSVFTRTGSIGPEVEDFATLSMFMVEKVGCRDANRVWYGWYRLLRQAIVRTELPRRRVHPGIIEIDHGIDLVFLETLFFVVVVMVADSSKTSVGACTPAPASETLSLPCSHVQFHQSQVRDPCGTVHREVLYIIIFGLVTGNGHLQSAGVEQHVVVRQLCVDEVVTSRCRRVVVHMLDATENVVTLICVTSVAMTASGPPRHYA